MSPVKKVLAILICGFGFLSALARMVKKLKTPVSRELT